MIKVNPLQELNYKIYFNDPHQNHHRHRLSTNKIRTTKFTPITFIPKALYLQFLRIANIYFLIIAVLSNIDEISTILPITSITPLIIVLSTSIIREAVEDWARHKNDKLINNQPAIVYRPTKWSHGPKPIPEEFDFQEKQWSDLMVGDIVKVKNGDQIPADIVVLESSDENSLAYVETANLDGEKNLKLKQAKPEIKQLIDKIHLHGLKGAMLVDAPNQKIHSFRGVLEIADLPTIYLNYSNIILRGTYLKNVDYVIGIVTYAGNETKLMQNQGGVRNKKSHIEARLNRYIISIFILQCSLCVLLAILSTSFQERHDGSGDKLSYIFPKSIKNSGNEHSLFVKGLLSFASFMLLLSSMIPISLMVSLEFTKVFQALGIKLDDLMRSGDQRCAVQNMLIHEDLAKIEYIFADKTGTLTTNEMHFMSCSIDGRIYPKYTLLESQAAQNSLFREKRPEFTRTTPYKLFWMNLSLCHDVVIDNKTCDSKPLQSSYHGSSPDEVELVTTAAQVGYEFSAKKGETYSVLIRGQIQDFLLLDKIDFSSDRKRMSVIVKDLQNGKIYLFCKGADSMVFKLASKECSVELLEKTDDDVKNFSKEGLRTLVLGYKELKQEDFEAWHLKFEKAKQEEFNVTNNENFEANLRKVEEEIEKDLLILGATALEDKIQDGVLETVIDLHKADIKIWMLTGDKLETAENIGYATNLMAQETKVFKVNTSSPHETYEKFVKIQEKIKLIKEHGNCPLSMGEIVHDVSALINKFTSFALIIDGDAITYTFNNQELKSLFVKMIPEFRTVICCRSTPNQKAEVVKFVKRNLNKMTLAIGDGGNDVNMIQRAHVGVGIFGKEGNQAAFASDYAICNFSFLWRLLFVHGRWNYIRSANFVNFFFYKNLIFTLPQFWFALYSGFSGQSVYDNTYMMNYNTIFTSVAPVYYASLEQDVNPRENQTIRKAMPYLYKEFRKKDLLSGKGFIFWWFTGIAHSVIIFFCTQGSFEDIVNASGKTFDIWGESVIAVAGVFFSIFSVVIIGTNHFNIITFICYIPFTLLSFFPIGCIIMDQFKSSIQYVLTDIINTPKVWPSLLIMMATCAFTVYIPKQFMFHFRPSLAQLLQKDRNYPKRSFTQFNETESCNDKTTQQSPTKSSKFDFDNSIIMAGWCDQKSVIQEFESPALSKAVSQIQIQPLSLSKSPSDASPTLSKVLAQLQLPVRPLSLSKSPSQIEPIAESESISQISQIEESQLEN